MGGWGFVVCLFVRFYFLKYFFFLLEKIFSRRKEVRGCVLLVFGLEKMGGGWKFLE